MDNNGVSVGLDFTFAEVSHSFEDIDLGGRL